MGIYWDYPNDEAVDALGVLTEHDAEIGEEPGWTRSVINKIYDDLADTPSHRDDLGGELDGDYDADELAAWEWYQANVLDDEAWDKLVKEYKADATDPDKVNPPDYDPDREYIDKPGSGFIAPDTTEYSGGDNPNRELSISTEAINYLAGQFGLVAGDGSGILIDARNQLGPIDPRPGGFARAELLRQKIVGVNGGDLGLRGDTRGLLLTVHEALFAIMEGLRRMAIEYDTAEEFNGLTADQLQDLMDGAWGKITDIGDHGQSAGTTAGG